jgi:hypothetical protein
MGLRYVLPQFTAFVALVRGLNRHLDTVAVAGMRPLAGRSGSGMIIKSGCCAVDSWGSLITPPAIDQGTSPADQAKPVKVVRPAGRCILTGLASPAPWRAGRRQTG